jgi:hypothetical protein
MRIAILIVFAIVVAILVWRGRARRAGGNATETQAVYTGLRDQMLRLTPAEAGITLQPGERVWMVLMEIGYPEAVATVVALRDGNASVYLSTGGGWIGGSGHETVRQAAQRVNYVADRYLDRMTPTTEFPLPTPGQVLFYARTPDAAYTTFADDAALQLQQHPLFGLYIAGQGVITEFRLIDENQRR